MSYSEKLKDPRWQKKRLDIFNRDCFKCVLCESEEKTLHAHHVCYFKNYDPWDYDPFFIITLFEDCHSYVHEKDGINEYLIMKKIEKLQSSIDFADGQKSYDIGGIMRFMKKNKLEINGDFFQICTVKREFDKEKDAIIFELIEDKTK
jgi:hypothetical protein